jgi:chromosome segregation ATPase
MARSENKAKRMLETFDPNLILELMESQDAKITELEQCNEKRNAERIDLERSNAGLHDEVKRMKVGKESDAKTIQELELSVLSLETRVKTSKELDDKRISALEQSVRSLTDDNSKLMEKISSLEQDNLGLQEKNASLEEEKKGLKVENALLKDENQEMKETQLKIKALLDMPSHKPSEVSLPDPNITEIIQALNSSH